MEKRLNRDEHHKMLGGVCAGLAEYLNIDVTIVRVVFLASLILKGGGFIIYVILWIAMPKKNFVFTDPNVDYTVPPNPLGNIPPQQPGQPFANMPRKKMSNGSIIAGSILIVIGSFLLLNQFDIIPDWDFENLWPVVLILVGGGLMVSSNRKQPWEKDNWANGLAEEDKINNEPPIL